MRAKTVETDTALPTAPAGQAGARRRDAGGGRRALDPESVRLVRAGCQARRAVWEARERLAAIEGELARAEGVDCVLEVDGVARVRIGARRAVRIVDVQRLARALGGPAAALAAICAGDERLAELACDADDPRAREVAASLEFWDEPQVRWEPER